jgi:hypothetical protein
MEAKSYVCLYAIGTSLLLAGCNSSVELQGSIHVDNGDSSTRVTYTYLNPSQKLITVIGGASYTLYQDNKAVEKGGVPVKDYIDLEPGKAYSDSKTFTNLPKGNYLIEIVWDKTKVKATFNRS